MDPLSLLLAPESEPEVVEVKEKRKRRGTLTKKALARAAEEARQQLIRQKQEFLKEIKTRVQTEWERNHKKASIYKAEFQEREVLMRKGAEKLLEIEQVWTEYLEERRKQKEWLDYLKCDGLPDPSSFSQVNSYIYRWTEIDNSALMTDCLKKTDEVMQILKGLEEFMNDPGPDCPSFYLRDSKELRSQIRDLLQEDIDRATFYLFSRIETDMESINVTTSKFFATCPYFKMSLWAELITPIPSKRKEIRKPLKVIFEDVQVTVVMPVILLDVHKVMRVMLLNYDHWSDKCRTFDLPLLPKFHSLNMYDLFMLDFEEKVDIMSRRERDEVTVKKRVGALPQDPTLSQEILAWTSDPQKSLSDEVMYRKYEEEEELGRQVKSILNEFEVNLRERTFLGNLLLLEVLHQPPQAQCLRLKHCVTLRKIPPKLQAVDYYVKFPPQEGGEEEEEEEAEGGRVVEAINPHNDSKREKERMEEEREKLISIRMLPDDSVLWFEQPQPANWDPVNGYWSMEDVHDLDFDEEEQTITFKTGRLGLLGLHVSRYCNLPYEDWVFETSEKEGVNFYLKTPKTELLFKIKAGKVCLETIESPPSKAMDWILGKYYPPLELIQNMKRGGIDVFPGPDASSYLEEIESKHVVIERNIYQVWGLFSKSFRFRRSKFNQVAGRANIVFQAQEVYKDHQVDFCLIFTTMCSCYVLDINEESEKYSSSHAPSMEKCADLYSLLINNCTKKARRMSEATCTMLIQTVMEFLNYVRPISFS